MVNGLRVSVCKKCFQKTFAETNKAIEQVLKNKYTNNSMRPIELDKRGKGSPKNTITAETKEIVRSHLLSIPNYESHYTRRDSSRKYIPTHFTLAALYEEFKIKYPDVKVYRKFYETQFHDLNLAIKVPNKDTCMTCDRLITLNSNQDKPELSVALKVHQEQADLAYSMKKEDKLISKENLQHQTFTFDLQQCLPTPVITSSLAFYKRHFWTYNLTIHNCDSNQAFCYLWNETLANRGANEVGSCLYKCLLNVPSEIKHVTMYSDTCRGQNKNSHIAAMCLVAMQNCGLETLDHTFLVSGHTHMESDSGHSVIEKKKKYNGQIEHPHDWATLIRQCGKKNPMQVIEMKTPDFKDYSFLFKSVLTNRKITASGENVNWRQIKWIRYKKSKPYVLFYKNELNEDQFYEINLLKRGKHNPKLEPPQCYSGPQPISEEKKKRYNGLITIHISSL